jgi:hypothetical protein
MLSGEEVDGARKSAAKADSALPWPRLSEAQK